MVSFCVKLAVILASCQGQDFLAGRHLPSAGCVNVSTTLNNLILTGACYKECCPESGSVVASCVTIKCDSDEVCSRDTVTCRPASTTAAPTCEECASNRFCNGGFCDPRGKCKSGFTADSDCPGSRLNAANKYAQVCESWPCSVSSDYDISQCCEAITTTAVPTTSTPPRVTCAAADYLCPIGFVPKKVTKGDRIGQSPYCNKTKRCNRGRCCNREEVIFEHESGMCIHPLGGKAIPEDETPLVLWNDCNNSVKLRWVMETAPSTWFILRHSSGSCADIVDDKFVLSRNCKRIWGNWGSPKNFIFMYRHNGRAVGVADPSLPQNNARLVLLPQGDEDQSFHPIDV